MPSHVTIFLARRAGAGFVSVPRVTCLEFEDMAAGIATVAHTGCVGLAKLAAANHVGRQRLIGLNVRGTARAPFTARCAKVEGGKGGRLSSEGGEGAGVVA